MTIHLPDDLSTSLREEVSNGHFPSEDQAVAEIVRDYLQRKHVAHPATPPDPLLGIWQDCADEIDEIVAEAYRQRREEPWRDVNL